VRSEDDADADLAAADLVLLSHRDYLVHSSCFCTLAPSHLEFAGELIAVPPF
jgi:hypothetical protein